MADLLLTRKTTISAFYRAWVNMKTRCTNKKSLDYPRYGGRGIKVCEKWQTFDGFIDDMYSSYKPGLTLDRIDNTLGYFKNNCRWTDRTTQARNTRNIDRAKRYEYKGVSKTVREWAEEYGIKRTTFDNRLKLYGWTIEEAIKGKRG